MDAKKRKLIKTIRIIPGNMMHCSENNTINGTLLSEIERVMESYHQARAEEEAEVNEYEMKLRINSVLKGALLAQNFDEWVINTTGFIMQITSQSRLAAFGKEGK